MISHDHYFAFGQGCKKECTVPTWSGKNFSFYALIQVMSSRDATRWRCPTTTETCWPKLSTDDCSAL